MKIGQPGTNYGPMYTYSDWEKHISTIHFSCITNVPQYKNLIYDAQAKNWVNLEPISTIGIRWAPCAVRRRRSTQFCKYEDFLPTESHLSDLTNTMAG